MNQPLPLPIRPEELEDPTLPALSTDPGFTDPGFTDPGFTDPGFTNPVLVSPTHVNAGGSGAPAGSVIEAKRALSLAAWQQLRRIAHELYEHQLYRESNTLFECLTRLDPGSPHHWYWLGRSFYAVGDPLAAARAFERGGRLSHEVYFNVLAAEALQRAGYPDRALVLARPN